MYTFKKLTEGGNWETTSTKHETVEEAVAAMAATVIVDVKNGAWCMYAIIYIGE